MTISTPNNRFEQAGNGVTKPFTYGARFLADGDIKAIVVTDATGAEDPQVLDTDYTVTGAGAAGGGTVTYVVAPAIGETSVLYGDPPITQGVNPTQNDSLNVDASLEDPLDRLTLIAQRNRDLIERSLRLPDGDSGFDADDMVLPAKVTRASKFFLFDADGKPTASAGSGTDTGLRTDLANPVAPMGATLVRDQRTEIGAQAFTLRAYQQNRLINIKTDFGAVGDGVTDDRVAIMNAYAASKTTGAGLFIPTGNFLVKENAALDYSLLFDDDVLLTGLGPESCIMGDGGDYALGRVSESGSTERVHISGVRFNPGGTGTFAAENAQWCLRIHKATKSLLITNCVFENFNEDALMLGFNATTLVKNAIVVGNHFVNGGRTGVALISVDGFMVNDNLFDDIDFQPIDLEPDINTYSALNGIIKGNIIRGGGGATFVTTRAAITAVHRTGAAASLAGKIVIANNVISGFGAAAGANLAHGIQTSFQNKLSIHGNVIVDAKDRGINVQDSTDVNVAGNTIIGGAFGLVINNCTRVFEGPNQIQGTSGTARSISSSTAVSHLVDKRVRVGKTAVQSIPNTTSTVVTWDTEAFDPDSMHDNATNNSRLTINTEGTYLIGASVLFATNAVGFRQVEILINGVAVTPFVSVAAAAGNPTTVVAAQTHALVVTDYVEVQVHQNSGGALDVQIASAFYAHRI